MLGEEISNASAHVDGFGWQGAMTHSNFTRPCGSGWGPATRVNLFGIPLPGIPVVFAGDEFGLLGVRGGSSRTPMPWGDPARMATDLRPAYAALTALHHRSPMWPRTAAGVSVPAGMPLPTERELVLD